MSPRFFIPPELFGTLDGTQIGLVVSFWLTNRRNVVQGEEPVQAADFVFNLFSKDGQFRAFTRQIGVGGMAELSKGLEALCRPHEAAEAAAVIGRTLEIFREVFARQSQREHRNTRRRICY